MQSFVSGGGCIFDANISSQCLTHSLAVSPLCKVYSGSILEESGIENSNLGGVIVMTVQV
jgi:hypothetical protein